MTKRTPPTPPSVGSTSKPKRRAPTVVIIADLPAVPPEDVEDDSARRRLEEFERRYGEDLPPVD